MNSLVTRRLLWTPAVGTEDDGLYANTLQLLANQLGNTFPQQLKIAGGVADQCLDLRDRGLIKW